MCLQIFLKVIGGPNVIRGVFIFWLFIVKPTVWISIKKTYPKTVKFILAPINKVLKKFGLSPINVYPPLPFQLTSLDVNRRNIVSTSTRLRRSLIVYTREDFFKRFFIVDLLAKFFNFFNFFVFLPLLFKLYSGRVQLRIGNVVWLLFY